MADIFKLAPHPAADIFPMLPEDELDELAADIRANGLQMPLVLGELDGETVLIDGRNRREACRRCGVEPTTQHLNGQDATAYILSANINRRHMSKGQRAMAVAKLSENMTTREAGNLSGTNRDYVSRSRTVLTHAPDIADSVLTGSLSLDKAYEQAKLRKEAANNHEAQFANLREGAPDLADLVTEEQLSLPEALAALTEREQDKRNRKYDKARALYRLEDAASLLRTEAQCLHTAEFLSEDQEIYEDFAKRPIDGVIKALETFRDNSNRLLKKLEELNHAR